MARHFSAGTLCAVNLRVSYDIQAKDTWTSEAVNMITDWQRCENYKTHMQPANSRGWSTGSLYSRMPESNS